MQSNHPKGWFFCMKICRLHMYMYRVDLYILHTVLIKERYESVLSFVNEYRREKAERYAHEQDVLLSLGGGYLLKKYLPNEEIKINKNGKPYLENGPYFNLSHSKEYVVLAISNSRDVGVDIELINDKKLDGVKYVLNEKEKDINDPETLFRIWSNKESLIKCLSTGIKDIKKVDGLPFDGVRTFNDKKYYTRSNVINKYALSVTLEGDEPFEIMIHDVSSIDK